MADKVFVYIDHFNGQAVGSSWEAVAAALSLGSSLASGVTALVVGDGVGGLGVEAIAHGATQAVVRENGRAQGLSSGALCRCRHRRLEGISAGSDCSSRPPAVRVS